MPSQEQENRARDDFNNFLARSFSEDGIVWRKGAEPPDFWLELLGELFAVEVTAIRKRYEIGAGVRIPFRAIGRELEALIAQVERQLLAEQSLRGRYAVQIFRAIPDLKSREAEILFLIRGAVTDLESQPINSKKSFMRAAQRTCSVIKLDDEGATLDLWGPTDSMRLGDAAVELSDLIRERIRTKRKRLRAVHDTKILVLDDQYVYSELEMFSTLELDTEDLHSFHSIYVARSGRQSVLLTSGFANMRGIWGSSNAF